MSQDSMLYLLKIKLFSGRIYVLASVMGACIEAMVLPMMRSGALMIHDFIPKAPLSPLSSGSQP